MAHEQNWKEWIARADDHRANLAGLLDGSIGQSVWQAGQSIHDAMGTEARNIIYCERQAMAIILGVQSNG